MVELHEPVSERIGKILRENREAQGLTRQQLSEKSTVSDRQISAIELGEKGPSMNSLELLLRSLGLSADQIFYPELTEADPMMTQITHLAATCTEQQKLDSSVCFRTKTTGIKNSGVRRNTAISLLL